VSDKNNKKIKVKSWYSNRHQIVTVQRNVLLLIVIVSIITVAISVMFVKNFMSSKSLEPYVIEIDDKTGMATVVQQISSQNYTANEAMRRYFLNKFIQAATGYNPQTFREDSETIRLFSAPQIYVEYRNRINPLALGSDTKIAVRIKSIIFKDITSAEVRITREIMSGNQGNTTKNEVIFIRFVFVPEIPFTIEERLINPLGFQVLKFDIGDEVYSY
jgi:type IV secretion system protein VirB8